MNKSLLLIPLSALLLSACSLSPTASLPKTDDASTTADTPSTVGSSPKSLKELLGLSQTQKCTYSFTNADSQITGNILISNNKFKQVATVKSAQESLDMTTISDGQFLYTWNSKMPTSGLKFKIDAPTPTGADSNQNIDMDKKMDYQCSPMTVTDADFALPSNIKFFDLSETVNNLKNMKGLDLEKFKDMIPQDSQ